MNLEEIINGYNELRDKCVRLAKENKGELMGEFAWLRGALSDGDITLGYYPDGICCYGSTYTTQTMESEWFSFTIPWSELED